MWPLVKCINHDGLVNITKQDSALLDGNLYTAFLTTASVAASSHIGIQINTSNSDVYLNVDANNSGGLGEIFIFEISTGSTYATGTTTISAINLNFASTNTATVGLTYNPANEACLTSTIASTQGYIKEHFYINSTAGITQGNMYEPNTYRLKTGTTYVVYLLNGAVAGAASMRLTWYEET